MTIAAELRNIAEQTYHLAGAGGAMYDDLRTIADNVERLTAEHDEAIRLLRGEHHTQLASHPDRCETCALLANHPEGP